MFPDDNDGTTAYELTVDTLPVDGFWSISVDDEGGCFFENPEHRYSLNNVTATPDEAGRISVHFGGDPQAPNHLPSTPGWNYVVRMYRPRPELLGGTWTLPEAQVVK